jgi:predicted nuclease of restriction endonuclease-like (RecB) superfamily
LEFVGLPEETRYSESEFEQKLFDRIEHFLLELGKGFAFVGSTKLCAVARALPNHAKVHLTGNIPKAKCLQR